LGEGSLTYIECIDWSLKYLDNYEEVCNTARTATEMVEAMTRLYPDVKAEDFAIHWQARLPFPHSSPDWLTPLPGKPAKIFLSPGGGYDGDPPANNSRQSYLRPGVKRFMSFTERRQLSDGTPILLLHREEFIPPSTGKIAP
jgi:hypothetical protein